MGLALAEGAIPLFAAIWALRFALFAPTDFWALVGLFCLDWVIDLSLMLERFLLDSAIFFDRDAVSSLRLLLMRSSTLQSGINGVK
jgi:hypothetical protein